MYLDNFSSNEFAVGENAMILILRTYRPEVIDWVPSVTAGQQIAASGSNPQAAVGEVASTLEEKQPATQLTQLAEDLFAKIGWANNLRTSGGCNKESPLMHNDAFEKCLWTMVEYPDRWVYYRRPYELIRTGDKVKFFVLGIWYQDTRDGNKWKQSAWDIKRTEDYPHPPRGNKIYLSIEIMKEERHPFAFARRPSLGRWKNWAEANRIAVRVRYNKSLTGSDWVSEYLQHSLDKIFPQDDNIPGSVGPWADMIQLRYYLERKTILNPPSWFNRWGIARVKELKWDHISQGVQVVDPPAVDNSDVVQSIDEDPDLQFMFQALGFENYMKLKTDTSLDWDRIRGRGGPKICDTCYVATRRHQIYPNAYKSPQGGALVTCIPTADGSMCTHCEKWGHACTFTPNDKIKKNAHFLTWYPPWDGQESIEDPGFETHNLTN